MQAFQRQTAQMQRQIGCGLARAATTPNRFPSTHLFLHAARLSTTRSCSETVKRFTEAHEWISLDKDSKVATMGITDYAQNSLGDVVFIELPSVGTAVEQGDQIGGVESVKAASDIYAPISGEISEVNEKLSGKPTILNSAAESDGWLCKIKVEDVAQAETLMDEQKYRAFTAGEDH